jgi:hypothetical protein
MNSYPNAADPGPHMALAAFEPCGCTGWISVLGYGHDADAYATAAKEAKAGLRIEHIEVEAWKARPSMYCADHPNGPPWWKRNGGKGKRPAEYAATVEMGL